MKRASPLLAALWVSLAWAPAHAHCTNVKPDGSVIIAGPLVDAFGRPCPNTLILPREQRKPVEPFHSRHDSFRERRDSAFSSDPFKANRDIFRKEREGLFKNDAFRDGRHVFRSDSEFFKPHREFSRPDRHFSKPGHGTIQRFPSQQGFATTPLPFTTGPMAPFTAQPQGSRRR